MVTSDNHVLENLPLFGANRPACRYRNADIYFQRNSNVSIAFYLFALSLCLDGMQRYETISCQIRVIRDAVGCGSTRGMLSFTITTCEGMQ